MKNENRNWFFQLVIIGFVLLLLNNCKKDDNINPGNPTNGKTTAVFNSGMVYGTLTDQDGNTYKTIVIGTQTWMAENLRSTKYRNGEAIPEITDSIVWGNLKTGAYCNSKNENDTIMIATYGRLYNWYAVSDTRNLAPSGWHVATNDDLTRLTDYLGGSNLAGGKLKETGTTHWTLSIDATNETGFTALPGGYHHSNGFFYPFGYYGFWWSATESDANEAVEWSISYNGGNIHSFQNPKVFGCSVRCVKD